MACEGGGVGDPCTPEDEYSPTFAGFKVTEENIESRSFQCQTRICLVNHFQGRVSCPLGQPAVGDVNDPRRKSCSLGSDGQPNDSACGDGEKCVVSATLAEPCDSNDDCNGFGGKCNKDAKFCECSTSADCIGNGDNFFCDASDKHCKSYVCHAPNGCQTAGASVDQNSGKDCCVPGTDTPVSVSVCGQCGKDSKRAADEAVYCSCRCGPAAGDENNTANDDFNFCECPSGFVCSEIRKNVGLGDPLIAGKYCIKEGTEFTDTQACDKSTVDGYVAPGQCSGVAQIN
jgi:hypothetical protein